MQKIRPHYYDSFSCIAEKCPDTCCAGWQIVIDEETLENYAKTEGEFGKRLRNSIDWMEESFEQVERRCCFLSEKNLCEIYEELGPQMLCQTCREYPRHIEEFEGRRELSLSLSCPVAARMILTCQEKIRFLVEETPEEEEFEEFDFFLFTKLEDAREWIIEILQDRKGCAEEKMQAILFLAEEIQNCVDAGKIFEIDEKLEEIKKKKWTSCKTLSGRYHFMKNSIEVFDHLEVLRDTWTQTLQNMKRFYETGEKEYEKSRKAFEKECIRPEKEKWNKMQENLLLFWIYTYFCGAVYDDEIYAKAMLSVFSTLWIEEICLMQWRTNEETFWEQLFIETAWKYAREIEHSQPNLLLLDELLSDRERFGFEKIKEAL